MSDLSTNLVSLNSGTHFHASRKNIYIYIYFIPLAAKEILEIKNGSFGYLMVLDLEEDMARAFSKPFAKSIIDS